MLQGTQQRVEQHGLEVVGRTQNLAGVSSIGTGRDYIRSGRNRWHHLRRKIDDGFSRRLIHTIRGVGYELSSHAGAQP